MVGQDNKVGSCVSRIVSFAEFALFNLKISFGKHEAGPISHDDCHDD